MTRRLGRLARTLSHLRASQLWGQLWHAVDARIRPVEPSGTPPELWRDGALEFLPGPAHARLEPGLRLRLIRRQVTFDEGIDWDFADEGPLFAYHLHQCDWLRQPQLAPERRAAFVLDWIEGHREGTGWDPHPTSLRLLSWSKLWLTPGALPLGSSDRERFARSLASQAETLSRNLELRLGANHLFSNLLSVVFAGLLFDGPAADAWLARSRAFEAELDEQIGPDGAHYERSPMYHALLLENVLDLLQLARARRARAPGSLVFSLERAAARMLGALAIWTHPDGEIALLGDAAFEIAHPPELLLAYAERLGVEPRAPETAGLLKEAGFARLAAGPFTLIASVGGPAPPHQPGHAHCDALAFELSVGRERVVTDTGVAEYIPGALRDVARATRSHATIEVGGREQAELWSAHRVGGRPRVELVQVDPERRVEATCAGWATPRSVHRRVFRVTPDVVELRDALEGQLRPARLCLPLAPGVEVRLETGPRAQLRLASGRDLAVDLPVSARWRVERTPYFPTFGAHQERACLVGESDLLAVGEWRFRLPTS
ncbi:MAG: heparinase II/III family protein [Proteobacteria bacterium]|nr:heparinase II/III family protein [Pseudomonadota bacterium]